MQIHFNYDRLQCVELWSIGHAFHCSYENDKIQWRKPSNAKWLTRKRIFHYMRAVIKIYQLRVEAESSDMKEEVNFITLNWNRNLINFVSVWFVFLAFGGNWKVAVFYLLTGLTSAPVIFTTRSDYMRWVLCAELSTSRKTKVSSTCFFICLIRGLNYYTKKKDSIALSVPN